MNAEKTSFFDAFTGLDLESGLYHTFSDVSVLRVAASNRLQMVRIELESEKIISRRDIEKTEKALYEQIFRKTNYSPKILVSFSSDEDATASDIFDMYWNTWKDEIREYHTLDYHTFCSGNMSFTDENTLLITCDDVPVAKNRSKAMAKYIEQKMRERFDKAINAEVK